MSWPTPFDCPTREIEQDWIDYNGHLNMAFYNVLFDQALDHVFDQIGVGVDYVKQAGGSYFVLEAHVCYLNELNLGDPVEITYQLLDWDAKRLHLFGRMFHAASHSLAATSEQLLLHIDMTSRKSAPVSDMLQNRLGDLLACHSKLPMPQQAGRPMGIRR